MRDVWIRGAAMTRFGKQVDRSARDLVEEALKAALEDAELDVREVQAAYVANSSWGLLGGQESIRGQVVLRRTGLMGVPILNIENADASASTALHLAWQAVAGGLRDCVVVVGFEKLDHRDRSSAARALNATMDLTELADVFGPKARDGRTVLTDLTAAMSTGGGRERFDRDLLAMVSVKNHYHGSLNPWAKHQTARTAEEVLGSRVVVGPLTRLMCAPLTDGAACLIVCSADFRRCRTGGARIAASVITSGRGDDMRRSLTGASTVRDAYDRAAAGTEDLDVVELFDATAMLELLAYERIGLCSPEDGDEMRRLLCERSTWVGGRLPVNPSGGLIARGHPMGATGAAQVVELVWQLEGRCGARQVDSARLAMAMSWGGWVGSDAAVCCVHLLDR